MIEQATQILTGNPGATMLTGFGTAAALILADVKTGVSLNLPGKNRLGAAGLIAASSAIFYIMATGGVQSFLHEVAKSIFTAVLITPVVVWYLKN